MNSSFTDFFSGAEKLHENGYEPIPITPNQKRPSLSKWPTCDFEESLLPELSLYKNHGIGLKSGKLAIFDADLTHKEASKRLSSDTQSRFGNSVIRVGKSPKYALFYRTDAPSKKLVTPKYIDNNNNTNQVEILGVGQQCIVSGIHPDTKKPYTFPNKSLFDTSYEELEKVNVQELYKFVDEKLIEYAEEYGWETNSETSKFTFDTNLDFDNNHSKSPIGFDEPTVKKVLKYVPNKDLNYEDWLNVVMAIHHEFSGNDVGLTIAIDWSSQSNKHKKKTTTNSYRSLKIDHKNPVTFHTVLNLAKRNGYKDASIATLKDCLDRNIFIEKGSMVFDKHAPSNERMLTVHEFRQSLSNVLIPGNSNDDNKIKHTPLFKLWMSNKHRKTVRSSTYNPNEGLIVNIENGFTLVNKFQMPSFAETTSEDNIDVFINHLDYLLINEKERTWFIDWMAFCIQSPGERCKVTPLLVSEAHGTGRGWIVELIEILLGKHNCKRAKMGELSGENAFNDCLVDSIFCVVDEVRETKRFQLSNKIRESLSEKRLSINKKYGDLETRDVYTNMLFLSNHSDALVIPDDDRRINVFDGPTTPKNSKYYTKLYEWLSTDGPSQVFWHLKRRDLSSFNWQTCFDTPARSRMIEFNKNAFEIEFDEFLNNPPSEIMRLREIYAFFSLEFDDDNYTEKKKGRVLKLLQKKCVSAHNGKTITYDGGKIRLWQLDKNKSYSLKEVKKIYSEYKSTKMSDEGKDPFG